MTENPALFDNVWAKYVEKGLKTVIKIFKLLKGKISRIFIFPLLLLVMFPRLKKNKRKKRKSPLQRSRQRSVLFLLHLSLLPNEENIVVDVPQEHATSAGVPKVDATLLVSLVPVISKTGLALVQLTEVRMMTIKAMKED